MKLMIMPGSTKKRTRVAWLENYEERIQSRRASPTIRFQP